MRFAVDEIVRVRMFDEIPDHWSKHMESLTGKIIEVFGVNNDDGTIVAGQLRSNRFIWIESDLEKFPLQIGCSACVHRYRMDEGHFAEQKINIDSIRGGRFRILDVRPEFGLPVAISIENSTIWIKVEDIDLSTIILNGSKIQLNPNQCFAAKKRTERLGGKLYGTDKKLMSFREMYGTEMKKAVSASLEGTITGRSKSSKPKYKSMVKATSAETFKWPASEAEEWNKDALFTVKVPADSPNNLWGKWENSKNPPPMGVKGIEPSHIEASNEMYVDFNLLEDEFEPETLNGPEKTLNDLENLVSEKEKKDPYAPPDDDIPF